MSRVSMTISSDIFLLPFLAPRAKCPRCNILIACLLSFRHPSPRFDRVDMPAPIYDAVGKDSAVFDTHLTTL